MKNKPFGPRVSSYPITIHTPYGVLRLALELDPMPCSDCGSLHASVVVVDVSPRLRKAEALPFLDALPDFLAAAGELAFVHVATGHNL